MSELNLPTPDAGAPPPPETPVPLKRSRAFFWTTSVIAILMLAAVAIPNLVKPSTTACKNSCIANLHQIDGAVQKWALENKKTSKDTYSLTDSALLQYLKGSVLPACPAGGSYFAGKSVADCPKCTLSLAQAHSL